MDLKEEIQLWQSLHTCSILVVDMAVLFEADAEALFDQTVLISASKEVRVNRLQSTRDWTDDEIQSRIQSQLSDTEKADRADAVIQNEDSLEVLDSQAKSMIKNWKQSILN